MRLKCPACRTLAGADAWAAEVDVEAVLDMCSQMPTDISRRVLAYLALFRPLSGRPMAWATVRSRVEDLKKLVDAPDIRWDRNPPRANNPLAWAAAMDRAISNPYLELPLKDHRWLRKVAYGIAGEAERNREALRIEAEHGRHGRREPSDNRYRMPVCGACGMTADNIVKGQACPYCGKTA